MTFFKRVDFKVGTYINKDYFQYGLGMWLSKFNKTFSFNIDILCFYLEINYYFGD